MDGPASPIHLPGFDRVVAPGGYAWWYVDAVSDDGLDGITVIAFVGSVFSPYYAAARRLGRDPDAADHNAINVALYGRRRRWAMTERGRASLHATSSTLAIGRSALEWDGRGLVIRFDETAAPFPSRVRGSVRLVPEAVLSTSYALDADGEHSWRPVAPLAVAEVDLSAPALRWRGSAYFDMNWGQRTLESAFVRWDWARARLSGGDAAVMYDVTRTDGTARTLSLRFNATRGAEPVTPPPRVPLPTSRWGIVRGSRADAGHTMTCTRSLEDGPFYARSMIASRWLGEEAAGFHETVSLQRFSTRWVQYLLPFRMPRAPWKIAPRDR